ncbi:MAG: ABC transporter ATP-binding protein [Acidimicrobiales bacterium]
MSDTQAGVELIDPKPAGEQPLLVVKNLVKHFPITRGIVFKRTIGTVQATDDVSFELHRGETLGLVGESGCGKSTTARTILGLEKATSGEVWFEGRNLTDLTRAEMREVRREMQVIFQDPYASLNPRMTVANIVSEPWKIHDNIVPTDRHRVRAQELLEMVGLNPNHVNRYPHQFSGGQRQRIGIARALALEPKLIIADEPVSALDVSVQAQVVNLLKDLQKELGLSYLFIAHDLSVVRHICDRVAVMYLGKIAELGDEDGVYEHTAHPYTKALLSAVPVPSADQSRRPERIRLEGDVPSPSDPPSGCRFRTRCWKATDRCRDEVPVLADPGLGHEVACHFPET